MIDGIAVTADLSVRAALFDLDGTLVDSEIHTDRAIRSVLARFGVEGAALPPEETRGRTWADISRILVERLRPAIEARALAEALLREWIELAEDVAPIPGSPRAVREAKKRMGVAVVSSSPREVIDLFLEKLGLDREVGAGARIGAESVRRSKPDPECFLLAAERLSVAPARCVVFEDSRAGLEAGRRAGMRTVFVHGRSAEVEEGRALADAACADYEALPAHFWDGLAAGALDLRGGRSW